MGLLVSISVALGCGHRPAPGEAISDVCVVANDGENVSVSGYLSHTNDVVCEQDGCPFWLVPGKGSQSQKMIRVSFHEGTKPRQVEVLKRNNFKKEDLVFRDDNGKTFSRDDFVRVTGKVSVKPSGDSVTCTMRRPTAVQKL